jgi:hypothetical protein
MNRQTLALGMIGGLIPLFISGINIFDGNRFAQMIVALAYVAAIGGVMIWSNRKPS